MPGRSRAVSSRARTLAARGPRSMPAFAIRWSMPWPSILWCHRDSTPARAAGASYDYLDSSCAPSATTLCLSGGRFKVTTHGPRRLVRAASGQAVALAGGDTGYFTFFDPGNVEVAVKVLNGCESQRELLDLRRRTDRRQRRHDRDRQSDRDGEDLLEPSRHALPADPGHRARLRPAPPARRGSAHPYDGSVAGSLLPPSVSESFKTGATEPCVADATTLCLSNSRYQVRAQWVTPDGRSGAGRVINLTGDTGAFWFFSPSNVEVVVKVLNGCGLNSRYWTFAGGLTDVNVILTVTDTQTGAVKTYINPRGNSLRADPGHECLRDLSVEDFPERRSRFGAKTHIHDTYRAIAADGDETIDHLADHLASSGYGWVGRKWGDLAPTGSENRRLERQIESRLAAFFVFDATFRVFSQPKVPGSNPGPATKHFSAGR